MIGAVKSKIEVGETVLRATLGSSGDLVVVSGIESDNGVVTRYLVKPVAQPDSEPELVPADLIHSLRKRP